MRARFLGVGALAALCFWLWTGEQPPPAAPARPGDCVEIAAWSNGYHSDITFQTDLLAPQHPLRRLDPQARYILVGWGDEDFFRSNGDNLWLGARALLGGRPTTMHVVYGQGPIEQFYQPQTITRLAVSRAGMDALARRLTNTLALDGAGHAQVIAPGHGGPRSWFLKARGQFNLFQVCNQWTARSLRAAGVKINVALLYTGAMLNLAVRGAPHLCPVPGASARAS